MKIVYVQLCVVNQRTGVHAETSRFIGFSILNMEAAADSGMVVVVVMTTGLQRQKNVRTSVLSLKAKVGILGTSPHTLVGRSYCFFLISLSLNSLPHAKTDFDDPRLALAWNI